MTALKSIADRFNITILVVHHTRKEESEDAFNIISGTNGLLGCANGAMVLQKPSRIGREATLDITGREVADLRLKLEFDESKHWQFIEYGTDKPDESSNKLLAAVQKLVSECHGWQGTPTELVSALSPILPVDTKPHSLTRRLNASSQALASNTAFSTNPIAQRIPAKSPFRPWLRNDVMTLMTLFGTPQIAS